MQRVTTSRRFFLKPGLLMDRGDHQAGVAEGAVLHVLVVVEDLARVGWCAAGGQPAHSHHRRHGRAVAHELAPRHIPLSHRFAS